MEPFSDEKRSRKTSKPDVEVNPERLKILEKLTINHRNRIVSQYQQIQELKAENDQLRQSIEKAIAYYKKQLAELGATNQYLILTPDETKELLAILEGRDGK